LKLQLGGVQTFCLIIAISEWFTVLAIQAENKIQIRKFGITADGGSIHEIQLVNGKGTAKTPREAMLQNRPHDREYSSLIDLYEHWTALHADRHWMWVPLYLILSVQACGCPS